MAFELLPSDAPSPGLRDLPQLGPTTFVVQRRINIALPAVQRGLADRTRLVADGSVGLKAGGVLTIDDALRPVAPFSESQPVPTWCGHAQLLAEHGRRVATVEVDVSMWSGDSTCITLRPVARHPERWTRWRLRQYFRLAHAAVDTIGLLLVQRAIDAADALAGRRVVAVGSIA